MSEKKGIKTQGEIMWQGRMIHYDIQGVGQNREKKCYGDGIQKEVAEMIISGKITRWKASKELDIALNTVDTWVRAYRKAVVESKDYQKPLEKIETFLNKLEQYKKQAGEIDFESSIVAKKAIKTIVERIAILVPDCESVGELSRGLTAMVALDDRLSSTVTAPENQVKFPFFQFIGRQVVDKQVNVTSKDQE
jgi:hypothetical protein